MSKLTKTFAIVALVILIDQIIKFFIKTHFTLGQEIEVFSWMIIHFTENNGMAFGWELGGIAGKIALTVFRIGASGLLGWYLVRLVREGAPTGYTVSIALIMAGAIGNIVDSMFFGLLFGPSTYYDVASLLPASGGYAPFLQGKVVDMLYFPLIDTHFPDWFPLWGGERFQFFRPVFNVADASISVGVGIILVFFRKYLKDQQLIP